MDDSKRMCIFTPKSPGSNPGEPMELVVDIPKSDYNRCKMIEKTLSVNSTHPRPQYSAGSPFIVLLCAFTLCLQYIINSIQKTGKSSPSALSILMPSNPAPWHALMPTSYHRRVHCVPSYGVFHFSKAFHITAGIKCSTISSVNSQPKMGSWS